MSTVLAKLAHPLRRGEVEGCERLLGAMDARAWSAVVPSMTYTELLGRLPALDGCGLPDETLGLIGEILADTGRVAREFATAAGCEFIVAYG